MINICLVVCTSKNILLNCRKCRMSLTANMRTIQRTNASGKYCRLRSPLARRTAYSTTWLPNKNSISFMNQRSVGKSSSRVFLRRGNTWGPRDISQEFKIILDNSKILINKYNTVYQKIITKKIIKIRTCRKYVQWNYELLSVINH